MDFVKDKIQFQSNLDEPIVSRRVPLILGIDTGGTHTDSVLIDSKLRKIKAKAKAITTKEDLAIGIKNSIEQLPLNMLASIKVICLSSTIATNAIIEEEYGKIGLLLTGGIIDEKLQVSYLRCLKGKIDIRGRVLEQLDKKELDNVAEELNNQNLDVLVISGFGSTRNSFHENAVRKYMLERLALPILCTHELSSKLGFKERTQNAILNASLIPVIYSFLEAVKKVIGYFQIDAKIFFLSSAGALIDEGTVLKKPLATAFSGPIASIIGAKFLSNEKDAYIIDIGGTTTDIASIQNGTVKVKENGLSVGKYSAQYKSAEVYTYGIGGDSHVRIDKRTRSKLLVGPRRVLPLCVAAVNYPYLSDELENIQVTIANNNLSPRQIIDCFALSRKTVSKLVTEEEKNIVELLKKGPHFTSFISEKLNYNVSLALENLVKKGTVQRISFTPTDLLHAMGYYTAWNTRIALIAAKILSEKMSLSIEEFKSYAYETVVRKITLCIIQSNLRYENIPLNLANHEDEIVGYFNIDSRSERKGQLSNIRFKLKGPIIAVGSPVKAWMPAVCNNLNARLIIPRHEEVANAVGAAVGEVIETAIALIRPTDKNTGFVLYILGCIKKFENLQDAKRYAQEHLINHIKTEIKRVGGFSPRVFDSIEDKFIESYKGEKIYIQTDISVLAIGSPGWDNNFINKTK